MLFLLFYYYSLVQDIFYSIYEIHLAFFNYCRWRYPAVSVPTNESLNFAVINVSCRVLIVKL